MSKLNRIAFASDHAGFNLKMVLLEHVRGLGLEVVDHGTFGLERVDYNAFGESAAYAVARGESDAAILVCGTGMGMSITANKIAGIRCAAVSDPYTARMSRRHNNANVLAIGSRVVGEEVAKMIVDEWLNAEFEPRHQPRLDKIVELEERERRLEERERRLEERERRLEARERRACLE